MALSKQPYRGTRDFFPQQKREQNYIFQKWAQVAEEFGYEPYDGPLLEEVDLYRAKSGEELINEQIYSFQDRGDRFVAIRPEMTPTLARMVAQVHQEVPKPIRWYSIPNLYRYEKPQRGRLREHWQLNVDIFGAHGNLGELEILQVIVHLFESFGAKPNDFQLHLNDRKLVDGVFTQNMGLTPEQSYKLYKIVDRAKKENPERLQSLLAAIGLNKDQELMFKKYISLSSFDEVIPFLNELGQNDLTQRWQNFLTLLKNLNLLSYCIYDPTIVRGLDYYTGIVFEAYDLHPDNRRALCGGGAYENLLKIFDGPTLPAVGFGLGDVTMTDFLKVHGLLPDKSVAGPDLMMVYLDESCESIAINTAQLLRKTGLKVFVQFGATKLKKAFELAEKKGAGLLTFLGEQEKNQNQLMVRHLGTREQKVFSLSQIEEISSWIKEVI